MRLDEFCWKIEHDEDSLQGASVVSTKTYLETGGRHRFLVCELQIRGRTRWVRLDRRGDSNVSRIQLWATGTAANDEVRSGTQSHNFALLNVISRLKCPLI